MSLFSKRCIITLSGLSFGLLSGLFCAGSAAATLSRTDASTSAVRAAPGNDQGTKGTGSAGKSLLPYTL